MKIAVTGHRYLAEVEKVTHAIDRSLDQIETVYSHPDAILSMLAEGADQLVVQQARARWPNLDLIVPLPLPLDDYLKDYQGEPARRTFKQLISSARELLPPPVSTSREEAYHLAGLTMLDLCDVLIAVWDGQPAQGEGGTGAIVAAARTTGKPIAWVHAGNRQPGTSSPMTLGQDQGTVSFERFENPA
ncbi:hypothetical protein KQH62_05805 [bacterium]|nr:hypothetical protein [bacterium]